MPTTKHMEDDVAEHKDLDWTSWKAVKRGTVRVKRLSHEHNTMSLVRTQTRTA